MATDRTTKILLTMIAVALWGLLLKPLFAPTPSLAAPHTEYPTHVIVDGPYINNGLPVFIQGTASNTVLGAHLPYPLPGKNAKVRQLTRPAR